MNLRMLARYPFLPEASEVLDSITIEDLLDGDEYYDARNLGIMRVKYALTGEKIKLPPPTSDKNLLTTFLSFIVAKLILIALQDPVVTRRFANVERDRLERYLSELQDDIEPVANAMKIRYRKHDDHYYIHFIDFIKYAKNFSSEEFRLLYQKVKKGWLPLKRERFIKILREAFVENLVTEIENRKDRAPVLKSVLGEVIEEIERLKDEYVSTYTSADLGEVEVEAFPPCIKAIIAKIQQGINVPHEARFTLVTFLHKIGMSKEDILKVFSTVPDFRKDLTLYQIRHITGEISGKEYSVPKCSTLRSYGLCIKDSANDKLCDKEWMTHPLLYYKIKKEGFKKASSRQNKTSEEQ